MTGWDAPMEDDETKEEAIVQSRATGYTRGHCKGDATGGREVGHNGIGCLQRETLCGGYERGHNDTSHDGGEDQTNETSQDVNH